MFTLAGGQEMYEPDPFGQVVALLIKAVSFFGTNYPAMPLIRLAGLCYSLLESGVTFSLPAAGASNYHAAIDPNFPMVKTVALPVRRWQYCGLI